MSSDWGARYKQKGVQGWDQTLTQQRYTSSWAQEILLDTVCKGLCTEFELCNIDLPVHDLCLLSVHSCTQQRTRGVTSPHEETLHKTFDRIDSAPHSDDSQTQNPPSYKFAWFLAILYALIRRLQVGNRMRSAASRIELPGTLVTNSSTALNSAVFAFCWTVSSGIVYGIHRNIEPNLTHIACKRAMPEQMKDKWVDESYRASTHGALFELSLRRRQ